MSNFPEILETVKATAAAFDEFKKTNEARLKALKEGDEARAAALQDRIEELESKRMNPGRTGGAGSSGDGAGVRWLTARDGKRIAVLDREAKAVDTAPRGDETRAESFSIGEFCRSAMLGASEGKAASSTATVPTFVGAQIIDRVRALTVLVRAGARTITVEEPTNLARISGDPTVVEHTEAATDISESDITLQALSLNPKLLAALVPLTVEVVADSRNLDDILQASFAAAFAAKIDTLGIAAIVAASGLPVSAAAHDPATWTGTNAAISAALAANQDLPLAHISTPANYAARSVILASTAGSWIGKPPYLAGMQELFTSSMTADQALFGDFAASVAIVVRTDLRLELVRHGKPTSGQHLLVAHMRAAPVVLQPARLFWQKKVP